MDSSGLRPERHRVLRYDPRGVIRGEVSDGRVTWSMTVKEEATRAAVMQMFSRHLGRINANVLGDPESVDGTFEFFLRQDDAVEFRVPNSGETSSDTSSSAYLLSLERAAAVALYADLT